MDATPDDEGDGAPDRIRQFIARTPHGVFGIFVSPNPYVDDPVNFARKVIRDKRLRTAVENHQAWISVDLMGDSPPLESPERRRKYEPIGKIMSAIAGPDCLAIYCPEYRRCNEFDFSLLDRLREKDPLALFPRRLSSPSSRSRRMTSA